MIALASSVLFALYFLFPQAIFTFVFAKFVPLRTLVRSRLEELNDALVLLFLTFILAYLLVWHIPGFGSFPFGFQDSPELRTRDYGRVVSTLASDTQLSKNDPGFWDAFGRCCKRQGRLLTWYYFFLVAEALTFGFLARNYGRHKGRTYRWIADTFLLPNISEWYPLLTAFTFPDENTKVMADLLCDDTLYRGTVAKHFLDKDGKLSGIILTEPKRFDRHGYLLAKDAGEKPNKEAYWRDIPSAKLHLFADHISNLNLNYEPPRADEGVLREYLQKILRQRLPTRMKVTFGVQQHKPDTGEEKQI